MRTNRIFGALALFQALALALTATAAEAQRRPEALVLSPEPGERVDPDEVLVAVSFVDPTGQLDVTSVRLTVGGRDITAQAELSGGVLTWQPREPLPPGPQRVELRARDASGAALEPVSWTFNVVGLADAAPGPARPGPTPAQSAGSFTRLHGSLIVDGSGRSVSGTGAELRREEDFLPRMWLNAGGLIMPGWRYAAKVHVSGYESADQQPVNRYRFDLRTPFLDVSGGDVNPIIQGLILSGRRVRGVQGELRAGPIRLAAVSGQSRRAIPALLDPLEGTAVERPGTFGQNLLAVRPAFGSGEHFQLGLTMLKVRDEVESIPDLRTQPAFDGGPTRSANAPPKDNLVLGADLTLRMFGGRVMLQYENGFSLLANDISGGPLTKAGLDSLFESSGEEGIDFDPSKYERWFILNSSLIPLDPTGLTNVAQQARGTLRAGSHLFAVEWRSIGGAYYTLGYPSLERDRRGIRVRDSFTLLRDALVVSAGVERDEDNLDDVKPATTTSSGGFLSVSWQQRPDAVLLTGAVRLGTRSNGLAPTAAGALDEQNLTLSGGIGLPLTEVVGLRTRLNLSGSLIEREDPANPQSGTRDLYLLGGLQGETPERTSTVSLMYGLNRSELTGFDNATTNLHRLTAGLRHRLTERWTPVLDGTLTAARSPEAAGAFGLDYNAVELLAGTEFEWLRAAVVSVTGGLVSYTDNRFDGRDTRELLARVRIARSF